MKVAILIDGAFFLKRYPIVFNVKPPLNPQDVARTMHAMALSHLEREGQLYRIFFYDCTPFGNKAHNPVTGRSIDFSTTPQAVFRNQFHGELKKLRKVALRPGKLKGGNGWLIHPRATKEILNKVKKIEELEEHDVFYSLTQKGIDIKIGLDIASLAYKKQVQQIILVSGDADFVPAAKLARREGIDFVLDPMWNNISPDLLEHIDGLQSRCPKPGQRQRT